MQAQPCASAKFCDPSDRNTLAISFYLGFGPVFAQNRLCTSLKTKHVRLPFCRIENPQRYAEERPPKQHISPQG